MLIYIDTDSGTWGVAEKNLVIFDADEDLLDKLEESSDSAIITVGRNAQLEGWA